MKQKNDAGFSLVEVLVAIVILAAFVVPTCSALVMSARMNAKTDALMQAQLDVSSAVETLMAEGIPDAVKTQAEQQNKVETKEEKNESEETLYTYKTYEYTEVRFPNVVMYISEVYESENGGYVLRPWYNVTVNSTDGLVEVNTTIRKVS